MHNYSGLTLNQYGVASPCPDLNLIHYTLLLQLGPKAMIFENSKAQNGWILCYCYGL